MNSHQIRYMFEHKLLPHWFFENKDQFVGSVLQDKTLLFNIISGIFEKEHVENPYSQEQFAVEAAKVTKEVMMLKLIFPEPEDEPLCYCSYLFFDQAFEKLGFFCIEKGNDEGGMRPFVCSWNSNGMHSNYGNCSFENQEDFYKCADTHMEREYGLKRSKD